MKCDVACSSVETVIASVFGIVLLVIFGGIVLHVLSSDPRVQPGAIGGASFSFALGMIVLLSLLIVASVRLSKIEREKKSKREESTFNYSAPPQYRQ